MADIRTSSMTGVPKGTTSDRPSSPSVGDVFYNGTLGQMEIYTANGWYAEGAPALSATIDSATNSGSGRAFNNGSASIAFTPNSLGGIPVVYTVTSNPGSFVATGSSSPITVTGLQSNTAYTFTMIATNSYGVSQTSNTSSSITATTVPNTPTSLSGDILSQTVNLTWSAPANGGSSITDYTIQYSSNSGSSWTTWAHTASTSTSASITGLTNGTGYLFRVAAVNANGTSSYVTSTTITPAGAPPTVEYLVVAGGGSADNTGGGAGGYRTATGFSVASGSTYTVTVGAGGSSSNGSDSVFATITSIGGGKSRSSGGSGGGGVWGNPPTSGAAGTAGQGNNGGNGGTGTWGGSGGGGGAGAAGGNGGAGTSYPPGGVPGNGGIGLQSSISGSATYYAGGGGGCGDGGGSSGGLGGGGAGRNATSGTAGTANTGGGAGGNTSSTNSNGGSGIVIIRYSNSYANAVSTSGSPSFSNDGTYKIYRWTASGSVTF